ncbi:MAG: hypothetical protein ACTSXT_13615 [Candidatus Helarchaeota archaeon]
MLPTKKQTIENPMNLTKEDVKNVTILANKTKNFLDNLKLTYSSSDHFAERKAELGEFFFQDENLGHSINVYIPFYGYQILAMKDGGKSFGDCIVFPYTEKDYPENKKYKKFIKDWTLPNVKIDQGIIFLVYIIEKEQCGAFFCKGTLLSAANKIINNMLGRGHFFFNLTGATIPNKKFLKLTVEMVERQDINITMKQVKEATEMILRKNQDETQATKSR